MVYTFSRRTCSAAERKSGFDKPILAVSADVTTDNATAVVAAGMQGILGKPFRQADLFRAVGEVMGRGGADVG